MASNRINSEESASYGIIGQTSADDTAILAQAAEILKRRVVEGVMFNDPDKVSAWLRMELAGQMNETFGVVFLTVKHRLIGFEKLFHGTVDGCEVSPRVVAQRALLVNAGAVIFVHNHPSGDTTPSAADRTITTRLREALAYFDIRVLDHFVVGSTGVTSMAARGLM